MSFFNGLLFGLTLQLAVGPVFFAVIHKAIREGFAEAVKMVGGVALVDAFYIGVSFSGVSALLNIWFLKKVVFWGGALVLIFLGSRYFKRKEPRRDLPQEAGISRGEPPGDAGPHVGIHLEIPRGISAGYSSLLYGIKLTLTNPLTIIFWSGVFGALIGSGKLAGLTNLILFSSGCVAATLLFLTLFSLIGESLMRWLTPKTRRAGARYLDYGVGAFLILFGILMFFK